MSLMAIKQAALRPASHTDIEAILTPRFETLGVKKDRTREQWAVWWADYFDALDGLTAASIEAGMRAYIRLPDSQFFPAPGKLRELASATPSDGKWMKAYSRARRACEKAAAPVVDKTAEPRPSAEDMAAIMADFHARLAEKAPPRPQRRQMPPTPCAVVDERGISAEAKALLARQGAA